MNKKFLITIIILLSIIFGLWIWTLAIPRNIISIGGSASVDPLMQQLTNRYRQDKKEKFIYSSTGSNTGINNLKAGVYDLAFISKDVPLKEFNAPVISLTKADFTNEKMFNNAVKNGGEGSYFAINFTNDPIVFIYNREKTGMTKELQEAFKFTIQNQKVDSESHKLLQEIYQHDKPAKLLTWYQLATQLQLQNPSQKLQLEKVNPKLTVDPYSSTPGSGTWSSFEKLTGVSPGEAVNKYGNNGSLFYQISKSPGAFGYVSLGYAQNISKNSQLESVIITDQDTSWNVKDYPFWPSDQKAYPLTRPFNALFKYQSQNKNMQKILDFVYWFCTNPSLKQIFKNGGLKQIMASNSLQFKNHDWCFDWIFISWIDAYQFGGAKNENKATAEKWSADKFLYLF